MLDQLDDLPLFAWTQWTFLGAGLLLAKFIATSIAYAELGALDRLRVAVITLSGDLLFLAAGFVAVLSSRAAPTLGGRPLRAALVLSTVHFLLAAGFVNVEFFGSWGSALTWELLTLTRHLAGYILLIGVSNVAGVFWIWGAFAIAGVLLCPVLQAFFGPRLVRGRRWTRAAWAPAVAYAIAGIALHLRPPAEYREAMLRDLSLSAMFVPGGHRSPSGEAAPLSGPDREMLLSLSRSDPEQGARAFAPLRGRRLNVVIWVWESVSARYLRSFHELGSVATPELDRLVAKGAVRFSRAYAECPLTVQTTWALMTGMSPPAKPFVFVDGSDLPPHGAVLHGVLRAAGYRTACFYTSYTTMWGTRRIFDLAPFDVFEDGDVLGAKQRYAQNGIGVEDRALVERFEEWVPTVPAGENFFALLWNTESHRPYTWADMTPADRTKTEYERYRTVLRRGDASLGRLYRFLESRGLAEDTLLIIVGDHGEGHGRGGRPWHVSHASQVFEDDVHVPLVFVNPHLAPSVDVDALCSHADILPTLADLLGAPLPAEVQGSSLARLRPPSPLFMRGALWWPVAVRAGRYKLLMSGPSGARMLFDLEEDPSETRDILRDKVDVTRVLTSALYQWHQDRFFSDPTFGHRLPPLRRLMGRPSETLEWRRAPSPAVPR